jgi:NAD(P)-dependent dehydrogenase (short-subunit alcohol dehydrogenase family)
MDDIGGRDSMSGKPELAGQTVVVIGGSSGIGLETARRARAEGADVILTARDPERLRRVGLELEASIAAFDATDFERLGRFFDELRTPIDHVLVTGPGPLLRAAGGVRPREGTARHRRPSLAAAAGRSLRRE